MWIILCMTFLTVLHRSQGEECECGRTSDYNQIGTRVFGGTHAQSSQFPWMAHLRFFDNINSTRYGLCGGYLIDEKHVMTAAHCVHDVSKNVRNIKAIEVYLGLKDLKKLNKPYRVSQVFYPHDYDQDSLYNDIAILRLQKTVVQSPKVKPICLPKSDILPHDLMTVIGYGRLGPDKKPAKSLMQVNVEYIDNQKCNQMLKEFVLRLYPEVKEKLETYQMPTVHSSHLCAVDTYSGGDACSGDSGGPLMLKNDNDGRYFAVGIVSGAMDECGDDRTPGFYTKVANFQTFIRKIAPRAQFCVF